MLATACAGWYRIALALTLVACMGGEPAPQAKAERVIKQLIDAYNAGDLEGALALAGDRVYWSDCDYRAVTAVEIEGKAALAGWLGQRFAEQDRLEVERIDVQGPNNAPDGMIVAGVAYHRRASDTLRSLGFPEGIRPKLGTKVAIPPPYTHIEVFANGPAGGSPEACRPT